MSFLSEGFGDVGVGAHEIVSEVQGIAGQKWPMLDLLRLGQQAIGAALAYEGSLPGHATRVEVARLISNAQGTITLLDDPLGAQVVDAAKDAVIRAYVEYNAVAEGNQTLGKARAQFFVDSWEGLKALPHDVGAAVGSGLASVVGGAFGGLLEGLFSSPLGLAVLVGGGYLLWRRK